MTRRPRFRSAVMTVFALALTQGCRGPVETYPGQIGPDSAVYLTRGGGLTLQHRVAQDSAQASCTTTRARGRVVRMAPDTIVLTDVHTRRAGRSGDCRIAGEARFVPSEAAGYALQRRALSGPRTIALVLVATPVVAIGVLLLSLQCPGGPICL